MAREFVMGARIALRDNFSRHIDTIRRHTAQFTDVTHAADTATRSMDTGLDVMTTAAREAEAATRNLDHSMAGMTAATKAAETATQHLEHEMTQAATAARGAATAVNHMQNGHRHVDKVTESVRKMDHATHQARHSFFGMYKDMLLMAGPMAAVTATLAAPVVAFKGLVQANADMETYQNTLSVVLKDQQKAADTLKWAQTFAAQTPFEIPEVVEATTKLAAYGMEAQKVLGITGDMAAVMGKSLDQAVEAIADAQTGELERLKEFGITKAMIESQGAKMGTDFINNSGQITDQKAFNAALFALMEDRYRGGMEMQSKTFKGMLSNAADFVGTMGRQLGAPLFDKVKIGLQNTLAWVRRLKDTGQLDEWIRSIQNSAGFAWRVMSAAGGIIGRVFVESYQVARQNVDMISSRLRSWYAEHQPQLEAIGQGFVAAFLALQTAFDQLRNTGLPGVVDALMEVSGWVVDAAAFFVDNWGVIGPILSGLGTAWAAYGIKVLTVTAYHKGWAAAQTAWNAVMAMNPIYIWVTAIGLLIAAGVLLYQNWDTVKAMAVELWEGTMAAAGRAVEAFKTTLLDFKDNAVQKVKDIFDDLTKAYEDHKTAINITAGILATIFGPALIATGIKASIAGAQMAGQFIAQVVRTGAVSLVVAGQIYGSIIASMIATGYQATINGALMAGQFIVSMAQASYQAVITGASIMGSLVASLIASGYQAVITAGKFTGQLIIALVTYAVQGWATAAAIGAQTVALIVNGAQAAANGIAWVALRGIQLASTAVTWAMTAAQWALNAALWANPITWVIGLIVGLIAVGVLLWKNWDWIKEKTIEVGQTVHSWIMQTPDWLLAIIAPALLIVKHWDDIKNVASIVWTAVSEAFTGMKAKVLEFGQQIMDTWDSVKTFLKNPVKGTINLIQNGTVNPEVTDGSHATGLNRVPFDGYTATLHRGEAVLTAAEANRYDTATGFQQQQAQAVMPSQASQAPVQDVLMRPTFQVPAPTVQNVTATAAAQQPPIVQVAAQPAPIVQAAAQPAPVFNPLIQAGEGQRQIEVQQPATPQRYDGALGATAQQPAAPKQAPVYNIEKLVEKVEIQAAPGDDGEALYEKFINVFHRKAKEAASILSTANMGELL